VYSTAAAPPPIIKNRVLHSVFFFLGARKGLLNRALEQAVLAAGGFQSRRFCGRRVPEQAVPAAGGHHNGRFRRERAPERAVLATGGLLAERAVLARAGARTGSSGGSGTRTGGSRGGRGGEYGGGEGAGGSTTWAYP
jgi:hypothetical protein